MNLIDLVYFGVFAVMIFSAVMWLSVYLFNRKRVTSDPEPAEWPSVSFLVPAYNEEEYIDDCIESLLNQDYPGRIEIIAINDGSTDSTLEKMKEYRDKIQIIDKENTGKASSMNYALDQVETDLVACMDADSYADTEMVRNMAGYFEEEGVKGVTPAMKVRETNTWAQKMMWTEFAYNILLRKLFSLLNAQWVMPGPGSIYDTDFLRELGGWDEETLTEDMEIAFRMFKRGAKLRSTTNAYTYTESPRDFSGLLKQRVRWYAGYIGNNLRYSELWLSPNYGNIGLIILPFNLILTSTLIFLASHMVYRFFDSIYGAINNYLLLGYVSPTFSFGVQSLSVFHVFYLVMGVTGLGILLVSLRLAGEKIRLRERKLHYGLFLTVYGPLYALFWIAAAFRHLRGGIRW